MSEAPKKRYRVIIEIDVHHGRHLVDEIVRWTRGGAGLIALTENDPPPNILSGGGYHFRYEERDEWVPEGEYEDALAEWWEAEREARREASA